MSISGDKIELVGMLFYGYHGASPAEQELGQRFVIDLDVHMDLSSAGASDRLEDTLSYTLIYKTVKQVVEGPSRRLLENVAQAIADQILTEFEVDAVRVSLKKPEVPIKGSLLKHAGVEIFRAQSGK